MLSIWGVSRSFGALRVLKEVSFDTEKNWVHGIIGPHGSGKTTLFNCIAGHLPAAYFSALGNRTGDRGGSPTGLPLPFGGTMKLSVSPQILALGTALAWGVGGFFEKKGLLLGDLSPQIGITVRTAVALVILAAVSFPQWRTLLSAEPRVWLYMILGGGVLAGAVGMLCFYAAIKGAPLSRVMPIAFTSPLFGALMGILFASEPLTPKTVIGMGLTVGGIVVLSI